jgi:hypothetical protein
MRYNGLFSNSEMIVEALLNEMNKNFRDRLVSVEEASKFDNIIYGILK